ncbi:carboxylesterase [Pseudonocardiaceae bacterium YIM PH 21723]|nr:carboxylesterase [Pseudonocardiaceae bacterium YIM PH 21723]
MLIHATARWRVRYGENLRFAGNELPKPQVIHVPTRHGRVRVFVYRPFQASAGAHVHFHGGAWLMRYPQMDDWWCRYLAAEAGVTVFNVDFRTGPYVSYPVSQHQCHDVARWVSKDYPAVSVGGFSSGGGLAASVCLQARDAGAWRPRLQVLGVPALDLATDRGADERSMISAKLRDLVRRVYFPDPATRTEAYASPVLAESLAGLPPAIVLTAERDALRQDGERYAERLREAGVPVKHDMTPGVDHYFLTENPERARETMATVAKAVAEAVGG